MLDNQVIKMPFKSKTYNKEYHHTYHKRKWREIKTEVLTYYGKGTLACVICGESRLPCLSIDHIHGGGRAHRRELGCESGIWFYQWLRRNDFPEGYQTLCMNCQFVKRDLEDENGGKPLEIQAVKSDVRQPGY